MPKVTEEYRSAKRDEIAHAAMVAFHRKGFHGTSMADIIAESGLSAGAIYGHYRSKSELVFEVAQRVVGDRQDEVDAFAERVPMPPPAQVVRVLIDGMTHALGGTGMLVQLWGEAVTDPEVRELATTVLGRLREVYSGYIALWHEREHGLSKADAQAVATAQFPLFVAAAQGYIVQSALLSDFDAEAYLTSIEKYLPA